MKFTSIERTALNSLAKFLCLAGSLLAIIAALRAFNHYQAKSAAIYFEELPAEVITTLRLSTN
jgi:hypothetical protein